MALSKIAKSYIRQEVFHRVLARYETKKEKYDKQAEICQLVNRKIGLALADYANKMMQEAVEKYPFLSRQEVGRVRLDDHLSLKQSSRDAWRRDCENEATAIAREIIEKLESDETANIFELLEQI